MGFCNNSLIGPLEDKITPRVLILDAFSNESCSVNISDNKM